MDRHALNPLRIKYAQKAAEAANRLGWKFDEAWLRIDALGWPLTEDGRFAEAEQELRKGLQIGEQFTAKSVDANDIIALASAFLAQIYVYQGDLVRAAELLTRTRRTAGRPVIQHRVTKILGELAQKQGHYQVAIAHYEDAYRLTEQYGGEVQEDNELRFRLGFTYLAQGKLAQAETAFQGIASVKDHVDTLESIYGKYGLARVAHAKGEISKAHKLAQEALDTISRFRVGHRLRKEVKDFLSGLVTPPA